MSVETPYDSGYQYLQLEAIGSKSKLGHISLLRVAANSFDSGKRGIMQGIGVFADKSNRNRTPETKLVPQRPATTLRCSRLELHLS
jgi:hypothetical protein